MKAESRKFTERTLLVAIALGGLSLYSCTGVKETDFPPSQPSMPEAEEFQVRSTVDPLGKWTANFDSTAEIEVIEQAAFTHLVVPVGRSTKQHCFVYREPILPGASTQKFFRAATSGLGFSLFRLISVDLVGSELLLHFGGEYQDQAGGKGYLQFATSPLRKMPMVCSIDGAELDAGFSWRMKRAFESFDSMNSFRSGGGQLAYYRLVRGDSILGFELSVRREGDALLDRARVSANYEYRDRELRVVDRMMTEQEDKEGLVGGVYRFLHDGRPELLARIDRSEATVLKELPDGPKRFSYEVRSEVPKRRSWEISSGKQIFGGLEFSRAFRSGGAERDWLAYVPMESLKWPTSVRVQGGESKNHWLVKRGETSLRYVVDEEGSPKSFQLLGGASGNEVIVTAQRLSL